MNGSRVLTRVRKLAWPAALLFLSSLPGAAQAQGVSSNGALTDLYATSSSPLERNAARANQAVYNAYLATGVCANPGSGSCTGRALDVFETVRELVQTAEQLTFGGSPPYSLGLNQEGLGFALRWTAAEELLAQTSILRNFENNQQSVLGSRMAAIRQVSRSNLIAALSDPQRHDVFAAATSPAGGAASADGGSVTSPLGFFVDMGGGYGSKDDTTFNFGAEDAFDSEGYEYTFGADYRLSNSTVVGALLGYSDRYIDFDSANSIVSGDIAADGYSLLAFVQWDSLHAYAAGSIGYQTLSYDLFRRITYPSVNPDVPSTNTATRGNTDSKALLATLTVGFPWQHKSFGAEAYLKGDYQRAKLDRFTEKPVNVQGGTGPGFEFDVGEQTIKSFDAALGVKLQWVFAPEFAVFVPFVRGEYHTELEDQPTRTSTIYAGIPSEVSSAVESALIDFGIRGDKPDTSFYTLTAGMSAVLRGSQQVDAGGTGHGGLQAYLQYTKVYSLENYKDSVINGGLRYEF